MSSREKILARIAQKLGRTGPPDGIAPPVAERIAAHPRGPLPPLEGDLVEHFRERAGKLSSDVAEASSLDEVPGVVAAYLTQRALPMEAVCWPTLGPLPWQASGIGMEARAAVGTDMVGVTGAFCGIAETGTLMLLSGAETPATVSLLPETHVAVVPESRIVPNMEAAWDLLRANHGAMPRAVNFVSGPSRTADIEQTVTLGAHGPYRVLIIVLRRM
jgi:L-lactate dehydrogenase complex protein LldG